MLGVHWFNSASKRVVARSIACRSCHCSRCIGRSGQRNERVQHDGHIWPPRGQLVRSEQRELRRSGQLALLRSERRELGRSGLHGVLLGRLSNCFNNM